MMNENRFIDEVWDKYESYLKYSSKDKFFKKHQYKNTEIIRNINTILSIFLLMITSVGIVYASTYIYKEINQVFSQRKNMEKFNINEFFYDMTFENEVYYKEIQDYEEYVKDKERFGNLIEMNKEDFNDNFIVVIALERFEHSKFSVYDYYIDADILCIELKNNSENINIDNNVISIKLNKSYWRENIKINFIEDKTFSENFIPLEELPQNYTKEQAIEDGCLVIVNNEIISENVEKISNFEMLVNSNKDAFIRIMMINDNEKNLVKESIIIKDIQYKNGEFLIAYDQSRAEDYLLDDTKKAFIYEKSKGILKTKKYSNNLKKYYIEKTSEENIFMKNSSYNTITICSYKEKNF